MNSILRKSTKEIYIGKVGVGGTHPISIQSMTNTKTENAIATLMQIEELRLRGCEIIRVAVPTKESVRSLTQIVKESKLPVIADIHYDVDLAFDAVDVGVACIRVNPGTFSSEEKLIKLIEKCKNKKTPMRIGINSGSLSKRLLEKYNHPTPDALVESAIEYVEIFEKNNFSNFKISIKSSSVLDTISAYKKLSEKVNYSLHLGLTEAGTNFSGTIKSSIAIGALLSEGIGDTIRVSLADNPIKEIDVAKQILQSLSLRKFGANIIACPTCGRCGWDVCDIASKVEEKLNDIKYANLNVAVMGCGVNGPGEAKEADFGLAGAGENVLLFKKGNIIKKIKKEEALNELIKEIENANS